MKANRLVWIFLFLTVRLPAQTITAQPTNQVVIFGGNVTFSVVVSGTGPFTYQWQFNGTNLPNNIITTVAGNGSPTYSGDGGAATNASLNYPTGVALDAYGNLFIADSANSRIREVNTNGIITTVVGNGTGGFSGDGGAATNASLYPAFVALDGFGNMFIADGNLRVRKVTTNGIITTVAGNGGLAYSGDGGMATNASLNVYGVAADTAGNLFIADPYNQLINKVDTNGIITTVAVVWNYPSDVAVDTAGNLFIAGNFANRIYKVDTNDIVTAVAGNGTQGYSGDGGLATNAALNTPFGVVVDSEGNLFIAERFNYRIRKVDTNGIISTVAGNGSPAYSGDGGAATNAALNDPRGAAVDAAGNLFIADTGNHRIRKVIAFGSLPTLTLDNVTTNNAGSYQVIITGAQGSVTSSVVTLTVTMSPSITSQPQNQAQVLGKIAAFSVVASSPAPLVYQWYFSNPALQTTAKAKAQISNGFVYSTLVTNGGSGYTTLPQVQFAGSGGSGAGGTAAVSNGKVTSITMKNAGSGYTNPPSVLIDSPNGLLIGQTNATLNLNAITTNNFGSYFVVISNIFGSLTSSVATLTRAYPPSLTQQPTNQTIGSGSKVDFIVTAAGTPPFSYQWWMVAGQQTNATALPLVTNGFVLGATITKGGAGYLAVPTVQFVGGSGSGASGTAVVSNRMVTAINMSNAGSGYTTHPTIQIAAPTGISLAGQTGSVLSLAAVEDTNAGNYYVAVTNNFGSVTSQVAVLKVALPGYNQITGQLLTGGSLRLSFVGLAGTNYALDRTFKLSPANWVPQVTNRAGSGSVLVFTNTPNKATNNFWRIRSVP